MAIDLRGRSSVSFYDTFSAFPSTGSTTTLYVDRGDMVVYIWNGSSYEQLNNGSNITTVANYSALLAIGASNVPNMFYWCSSAQGTSWLPGPLGGTYYNSGLYYSNGTSWEYMNSPYQATQLEVDAGIVADKFVTPSTFYNSSKWDSIPTDITIGTTPITSGVAGRVLFEGTGNVVQEDANFTFDSTLKRLTLKAAGALSTDIVQVWRNSADTANILTVNGRGQVWSHGGGFVSSNTAYGIDSLVSNTTGVGNTAIGREALNTNIIGGRNTAVGNLSLATNTASDNTAFGSESLRKNTTGDRNTAVGTFALLNNLTLPDNSAFGYNSLLSSTGQRNSGFGVSSLSGNTTGNYNTGLGAYALNDQTTGSENIAIGFVSGRYIADGSTSNLISNNSIFLGNRSKALSNNQTNQIVIGYNAIGGGNNTVTLGNISIVKTILRGTINAANLPTSATGLVAGDIWNNGGVLNIV